MKFNILKNMCPFFGSLVYIFFSLKNVFDRGASDFIYKKISILASGLLELGCKHPELFINFEALCLYSHNAL